LKTINLIGSGRVGQTLGRLMVQTGACQVQDVLARSITSAKLAVDFIGTGHAVADIKNMQSADFWMLAVPDQQIAPVAAALAQLHAAQPAALVFHCSGALGSKELQPLQDKGWQVASAHCLLSFAKPETALSQFAGTPCALEGDADAVNALRPLFEQLGAQCFELAATDKLAYHAGAVFATNFLPVLQHLAEQLWQRSGMPPELALQLRTTLLTNAVNNIIQLGPQGALTGPAARGDSGLVAAQGQVVEQWNTQAGSAYRALSALAADLAASRQTSS
jgi:predicted short-subunit dehydrogenase-like oxidoreductase (DUF2520 family)